MLIRANYSVVILEYTMRCLLSAEVKYFLLHIPGDACAGRICRLLKFCMITCSVLEFKIVSVIKLYIYLLLESPIYHKFYSLSLATDISNKF